MTSTFYYLDDFQAAEQGGGIQVEPCGLPEEKELSPERSRWLEFTGLSTGEEQTVQKANF